MKNIFKKKKKAIIFDLDGCIVDSSQRFKRLDLDAFDKKDKKAAIKSIAEYNKDCEGDLVIDKGVDLLYMLESNYRPNRVFFVTARGSYGFDPTLNWLKEENIWDDNYELIMQPEDFDNWEFSTQADHAEFKKKVAKEIMKDYDVVFAVDDSEDNCKAYASLGIPTIKFIYPVLGRVLV